MAGVNIRRGGSGDLAAVAQIQAASPELALWDPADYLAYDFMVAESAARVLGFIVARRVAEDETEILNLAVHPTARRCGIAGRLMTEIRSQHPGAIYLEVRESNQGARKFYQVYGFTEVSIRPEYYESSGEAAIVMKFHSC